LGRPSLQGSNAQAAQVEKQGGQAAQEYPSNDRMQGATYTEA